MMQWTKPYYWVTHLVTNDRLQLTVSEYENFSMYFVYSWVTLRVVEEGYKDSIEEAKSYLEIKYLQKG